MARRLNRRQMLAASAATLGYFHLGPAFSAAKVRGANEKLTAGVHDESPEVARGGSLTRLHDVAARGVPPQQPSPVRLPFPDREIFAGDGHGRRLPRPAYDE